MKKLLIVLVLTACGGPSETDAGLFDAGSDAGPIIPDVSGLPALEAGNAVDPGDPLYEGQQRFLWDAYGTERVSDLPPASFFLELMETDPMFADQFASFGFIADPNDDFPVGLKRGLDDPTRVQTLCALCHVARLPDGRLWMGAPNGGLDLGRFYDEVDARWTAAGNPSFLTELERTKNLLLGPGRTGAESSGYMQVVPADFPPYFGLGRRIAMNYLGTSADLRSEVYLAVFVNGAGNPNPRQALVPFPPTERLHPMIDFMAQLEPPPAPAQDSTQVAMGQTIYEREGCDSCHHAGDPAMLDVVTYDNAVDGIERIPGDDPAFPRGSIRTSYLHRILVDGDGMGGGMDEGIADLILFISANDLSTHISDGYRAADLRMLWYTAPYLHNGSVPTLEDLLRPAADRPTTFDRNGFSVDTAVPGNDNRGHEFGTAITDSERTALAAYLRSL